MPDELRLRDQAHAVIQSGKLSSHAPDRTWEGPGFGAPCSVCEKPVTNDELEFEIGVAPVSWTVHGFRPTRRLGDVGHS